MRMTDELESSINEVAKKSKKEINRAIKLHGLQDDVTFYKQLAIIGEESGEVSKDILEKNYKHALVEIVHVVSMYIKLYWLIKLKPVRDLRKKGKTTPKTNKDLAES